MKTIALIACSGSKNPLKKKAQELYTGKTFVLARPDLAVGKGTPIRERIILQN